MNIFWGHEFAFSDFNGAKKLYFSILFASSSSVNIFRARRFFEESGISANPLGKSATLCELSVAI